MTLGFIGTGAIATAIVIGLSSEGGSRPTIRLSPRNAEVAGRLGSRFDNVSICASNQEVLDACGTVVLSIRPQVAEEVLSGLHFSSDQVVISLVAGFPVQRVAGLVAPAQKIWRAIPLPSVGKKRGPIAIHPPGGAADELFAQLGQVFGIEKEEHLNVFSASTSTMAPYFSFVGSIASWMARKGIPEQQAREYVADMFSGLARTGSEERRSFEDLAQAHATPGGLNEQVVRDLTAHGVFEALTKALDSVHRRASGQAE